MGVIIDQLSPSNKDLRVEMLPIEGDQSQRVETILLWKRGQFVPLTGDSEQLKAIGSIALNIQIFTESGNEYRISGKLNSEATTGDDDIRDCEVHNVRTGTKFTLPGSAASAIVARVGFPLEFGTEGNTSAVKEILLPNGSKTRVGGSPWCLRS